MSIVQTDPVRVVFSLTDKEYLELTEDNEEFKNTTIKLKMANGVMYNYNGVFKYTDNQINKQTNTIAVYAYFKNDKNKLLPNEFVTVEVYRTFKDGVLIDKNILIMRDNGNFVIVYRNNIPVEIPVQIISETDNFYVLKNNFNKDDLLILTPDLVTSPNHSSGFDTEK
jgi:membrane fusion protein (multidrug efflux system)